MLGIGPLLVLFFVMLSPILVRVKNIYKLRVIASRKCVLDGEEADYVYPGLVVGAFYNHRDRRIYIHEKLKELLSEDERKAILYHECRINVQALNDCILYI